MKSPYYDEVYFSINCLMERGYIPVNYDDGGDGTFKSDATADTVTETVCAVTDCRVYFKSKEGTRVFVWYVLGNEPGIAICDYSNCALVEEVVDLAYEKFTI